MRDRIKIALVAGLCLLAQCHAAPRQKAETRTETRAGAAPPPYAVSLSVALTARAAAQLDRHPEALSVTARYYGLPLPATQAQANRDGVIDLGVSHQALTAWDGSLTVNGVAYPRSARIAFTGKDLSVDALKAVAGGRALVQIKVTEAHKRLDCTGFQDYVATARSRAVTLVCDAA